MILEQDRLLLTGKAYNDFRGWYLGIISNSDNPYSIYHWDNIPFSMQFGILVEWFDSVDMTISSDVLIDPDNDNKLTYQYNIKFNDYWKYLDFHTERLMARLEVIREAVLLYNDSKVPQVDNCFEIVQDDKFFPDANEWMWDYCTFLGKFVDSNGRKYDLGIHEDQHSGPCDATVFDNKPGSYSSGIINEQHIEWSTENNKEWYIEMIRRARILKIIDV